MHRPPFGPVPGGGRVHAFGFRPGLLLMLLIVVLLIVLIVLLLRRPSGTGTPQMAQPVVPVAAPPAPARVDLAVEEVRLRYARGEINEEEFRRLVSDLGATTPTGTT